MACASTEPGDSSAPLRAVESSEFGEGLRGEGFGSIGPAAFGTPSQQASLGDLQALQARIQDEQAKARAASEGMGRYGGHFLLQGGEFQRFGNH